MQKVFISKEDLMNLGFRKHQAQEIIRLAKIQLANEGLTLYNNSRIRIVPAGKVEELLGTSLEEC